MRSRAEKKGYDKEYKTDYCKQGNSAKPPVPFVTVCTGKFAYKRQRQALHDKLCYGSGYKANAGNAVALFYITCHDTAQ